MRALLHWAFCSAIALWAGASAAQVAPTCGDLGYGRSLCIDLDAATQGLDPDLAGRVRSAYEQALAGIEAAPEADRLALFGKTVSGIFADGYSPCDTAPGSVPLRDDFQLQIVDPVAATVSELLATAALARPEPAMTDMAALALRNGVAGVLIASETPLSGVTNVIIPGARWSEGTGEPTLSGIGIAWDLDWNNDPDLAGLLDPTSYFLYGIGPLETSPVFAPCGQDYADPALLAWDGVTGDGSCQVPLSVDAALIAPAVFEARDRIVFMGADRISVSQSATGEFRIPLVQSCSFGEPTGNLTMHCTAFLEPGGAAVLTAAHCLAFVTGDPAGAILAETPVGSSAPCPADTPLELVSIHAFAAQGMAIPADWRARCASVSRIGDDVVRIALARPLPEPATGPSLRIFAPGDQALLTIGRRVYSNGFPRATVPHDIPGGRIVPMRNCREALIRQLRADPAQAAVIERLPADVAFYADYGCTSLDTMVGGSGGPVYALPDGSDALVLIGVVVAAAVTDPVVECAPSLVTDSCDNTGSRAYNVFALLPETIAALAGP